jgi:hypothetical protein
MHFRVARDWDALDRDPIPAAAGAMKRRRFIGGHAADMSYRAVQCSSRACDCDLCSRKATGRFRKRGKP